MKAQKDSAASARLHLLVSTQLSASFLCVLSDRLLVLIDSMLMSTGRLSLCPSCPPSRRHPAGALPQDGRLSADPERGPSPHQKAKAKAGGLRVAIPGETISEAAAVLGSCAGHGKQAEDEGLEVVSGLISGIAARVADQAVTAVQKEKVQIREQATPAPAALAAKPPPPPPVILKAAPVANKHSRKLNDKSNQKSKQPLTVDVDMVISADHNLATVTVTPMGQLRQTCTPNSRYGAPVHTHAQEMQPVEGR